MPRASVRPQISNEFDLSLHPLPTVEVVVGKKRSTIYAEILSGHFVPPVKISSKSSRWPGREISAINAARIAGKSSDEIQKLVSQLVAARKEAEVSANEMAAPTGIEGGRTLLADGQ